MNNTYATTTPVAVIAIVLALVFSVPTFAQQKGTTPDFTIGKAGVIHLNVPVKAGSDVLQPGMYQVQHAWRAASTLFPSGR